MGPKLASRDQVVARHRGPEVMRVSVCTTSSYATKTVSMQAVGLAIRFPGRPEIRLLHCGHATFDARLPRASAPTSGAQMYFGRWWW